MDTPRPSPRTNRTPRVPHPVLIGHPASLTPASGKDKKEEGFKKRKSARDKKAAAKARDRERAPSPVRQEAAIEEAHSPEHHATV